MPHRLRTAWPALLGILVLASAACNPAPPNEGDYVARIEAARAGKDAYFRDASESPIPNNRKDTVLPLAYFPVDENYNVPATLNPSPDSPRMMMITSTGTQEEMIRVGRLDFMLLGEPLSLTAFVAATSPNMNRLFVPFNDLSSGSTTYPAGRYLELDRTPSGVYEMDFNTAFNPYCYYSPTYICPLPPAENRLKVPIHAGEQIKETH